MTILTPILICLAVAAILGALWLFAPEAALQATISVGVIAALGISGGIFGVGFVVVQGHLLDVAAAPPVVSLGSLPLQDLRMGEKRQDL